MTTTPEMLGPGFNDGDGMDAATAISAAAQIEMAALNVSLPVRVLSFDAAKNQVKVQPTVLRVDPDGQSRAYPAISACPVQWPCGGGFAITWPLVAGDYGLLVFATAAIDQWVTTGAETVKPVSGRRGSLSDGVFIPGVRPQRKDGASKVLPSIAGGGLSVGKEDMTARLHISAAGVVTVDGAGVKLGANPTGHVPIAESLDTYIGQLITWLSTPPVAPPGGGPCTFPLGPPPTPPTTFGSSLVEIE